MCTSGRGAHPVRTLALSSQQPEAFKALCYSCIPGGLQTSASVSRYTVLSRKEKLLKCEMSAVVSPNSTKLCWLGPRETSWTSLEKQALSRNICACLCLRISWPLRKWIYLCERVQENLHRPLFAVKVLSAVYYGGQIPSLWIIIK